MSPHRQASVGMTILLLCLFGLNAPCMAEEETQVIMSQEAALDGALIVAIVLAIAHFTSPRFGRVVETNEVRVSSFGGGLAAAYVFLHLMTELDKGHELVGRRIHLFVLFGFLVYYGIEVFLNWRRQQAGTHNHTRLACLTQIAFGWIYSWLILYSMPESIQQDGFKVIPVLAAMIFHVVYSDFHLSREFPDQFNKWGRHVLATAPLLGWGGDVFYFEANPAVSDLLTAILAGAIIYKLFKHELPEHHKSSFAWFLIGVAAFVLLDFASEG